MKTRKLVLLSLVTLLITPLFAETARYADYKNEAFNYEIKLPAGWFSTHLDLEDRHLLYCYPDRFTKIKVKALKSDEQDLDRIVQSNIWKIRDIDPRLNEIIETGKISVKKNVYGKLLVCEYRSRNNRFLQRTLIAANNGIIYVVECRAPIKTFYRYEPYFNSTLTSFGYLTADDTAGR